jgi:hypothetical protein
VTVDVSRSAGDANLAVQGVAALAFTPANWSAWQTVTLVAGEDANGDNEVATFQLAGLGVSGQAVVATALDDDLGPNLALATGGSKITGGAKAALAIDGIHTVNANYGYMNSTSVPPGTLTLDLKAAKAVARVRVLNWNWLYRVHRYTIESSTNGTAWTMLVDASATDRQGWDDWAVNGTARYLRITGLSNSANSLVCIAEWEVYGPSAPGRRNLALAQGGATGPVSLPATVVTSDGPGDGSGWAAVDGDLETAWTGQKPGGGYILVGYDPTLQLTNLEVNMARGSLTNIQYLYSLDSEQWLSLPADMGSHPVALNYLWLLFPDDGTAAVPNVLEISPNP